MTQATTAPAKTRAQISERTLRKDPWWRQPAINATALGIVVIYLTWASLVNGTTSGRRTSPRCTRPAW